jgi:hypothetical protein
MKIRNCGPERNFLVPCDPPKFGFGTLVPTSVARKVLSPLVQGFFRCIFVVVVLLLPVRCYYQYANRFLPYVRVAYQAWLLHVVPLLGRANERVYLCGSIISSVLIVSHFLIFLLVVSKPYRCRGLRSSWHFANIVESLSLHEVTHSGIVMYADIIGISEVWIRQLEFGSIRVAL